MITAEFREFHGRWQKKADGYSGSDLQSAFDRFFSQYVIFNRLYAELTFHMAREGKIKIDKRTSFPDCDAATDYVIQFLGSKNLNEALDGDAESANAIKKVAALLGGPTADGRQFSVKLDMVSGASQRDVDLKLLEKFKSASQHERASAVLEFLYAVRCNLFHGHKGFDPVQIEIMKPANTLLRHVSELVYAAML